MEKTESQLALVFYCYNLPGTEFDGKTEARLGIQQGNNVIEDVPADSENVVFTISLRVILNAQTEQFDLRGPFVQGKAGERFVYLVWGQRDGANWTTLRRAKFYLRCINSERLIPALDSGQPISVRLNMTDAKGKPLTASIHEPSFQFQP